MLLDVRVLGALEVYLDGEALSVEHERGILLLAWLSIWPGARISRDRLAELLWPEEPDGVARRRLRQVLYTLRRSLEEDTRPEPFLVVERESIALPPSPQWSSDLRRFWTHMHAVEAHAHRRASACLSCLGHLRSALAEVGGPLLAALQLPSGGGPELEAARSALLEARIGAHLDLGEYALSRQDWTEAREQGEQVRQLAPLDERGVRLCMRALLGEGRRAEAGALYQALAAALEAAGAPSPSDLTEELYQDALHTAVPASPRAAPVPPAAGGLVGRATLLRELTEQLSLREVRLLTLHGLGGSGKTRLALAAAEQLAPTFRGGAWVVEARNTHSARELVLAIRAAVGLPHAGSTEPLQELGDWLRPQEALLVLDNLEQNDEAADVVATLLRLTPEITVLATSRAPLGLRAEYLRRVEGLEADAVCALWLARARQLRHDLEISPELVAALCAGLGGLPLAIELSAAHAVDAGLTELGVGDVLTLRSGLRDLPADHRSTRALLESHLRRLAPASAQALAALAIFRGSFDAAGAEAVSGVSAAQLAHLERVALLSPAAPDRWHIHPLVQAYLRAQWLLTADAEVRHRTWLLDLSRERPLETLRLEHADLQAAWRSAVAAHDEPLLAALAYPLDRLLFRLAWYHESSLWYREALAALEQAGRLETEAGRRLLAVSGIAAWRLGDGEAAEEQLRRAVEIACRADDPGDIGQTSLFLGFVLRNTGRVREAVPLLDAAAEAFARAGLVHESARARYSLATACYDGCLLEEARTRFLRLLPELSGLQMDDTRHVSEALLGLTEVLLGDRGGLPRILGAVREMRARDNPLTSDGLSCLAVAELLLGRPAEARRRARAARALYVERRFPAGVASMACYEAIAAVAARLPAARTYTIEAVAEAVVNDNQRTLTEAALAVAWLLHHTAPAEAAPWAATVAAQPQPIAVIQALHAMLGPLPDAPPIPADQLRAALVAWRASAAQPPA